MKTLKDLIQVVIMLIDAGASLRFFYCLLRIIFNPDELNSYKKKMKNLGIFIVLATCCLAVSFKVKKYFI